MGDNRAADALNERVAVLETRVDRNDEDIASLRDTRHKQNDKLQDVSLRAEFAAEEMEQMTAEVIPHINQTMTALAQEQIDIRKLVESNKTGYEWVMKILSFAVRIIEALGVGAILWVLSKG